MHNRTRASRALQAQEPLPTRIAQAAKMRQYRESAARVLAQSDFDLEDKLLRANPDFATLWNSRRRHILATASDGVLPRELALTQEQLMRFPKSYGAWYHRRWAMEHLRADAGVWAKEMALCDALLERDARNFHCWAHRAWVASQLPGAVNDLAESRRLIEKNFSNYSAWHLRARALRDDAADAAAARIDFAVEFELTSNAFYTEPADQSAWMYYRWLLARAPAAALQGQAEAVQALLDEEGDCKWALLALLQLGAVGAAVAADGAARSGVVARLRAVDAMHARFYDHLDDLIAKGESLRPALFCT